MKLKISVYIELLFLNILHITTRQIFYTWPGNVKWKNARLSFFKITFRFPTTPQDTYCLLDLWTVAKLFLQRYLDEKKVHNILAKEQLLLILLSNWTSLNEEELISYLHILITHESLTPRLSNKHRHTPSLSLLIFFWSNTPSRSIPYLHYIETFFFSILQAFPIR